VRYVALLRGINVGGHKKVAMGRLRELLEALGLQDVRTHLQSGNAVFGSELAQERLEHEIEQAISRELGMDVRVLVRSRDELAAVVDADPFQETATDPSRYLVTFLSAAPSPQVVAGIDPADHEPDRFHLGRREIYLWCPNGLLASELPKAFSDKRLGVATTTRNWRTVTKLSELADSGQPTGP